MGCGCGGASNVYKPPTDPAAAEPQPRPAAQQSQGAGFPAVWNGPKPNQK